MTVAVGGSRHLTNQEPLVRNILAAIHARGWGVATGCARGIDATVRRLAVEMGLPLAVFAVGSWDGKGWDHDRVTWKELRDIHAEDPHAITWAAGGYGRLRERLRNRTLAMVRAPEVERVVMILAWDSVGSQLAMDEALRLGKWRKGYSIAPHEQGGNP